MAHLNDAKRSARDKDPLPILNIEVSADQFSVACSR